MKSWVWGGGDIAVSQAWRVNGHCGIDIACVSGTRIYAARPGYVERIQQGMFSIRVGNQRDFYLHGQPPLGWHVGDWVAMGMLLLLSDTVTVDPRYPLTGPHLHFEIQNGYTLPGAPPYAPEAPLDPVPVLLAAQPYLGGAASQSLEEDDMIFVGPIHKLPAPVQLHTFTAGSSYRWPINDPHLVVGGEPKGMTITFDSWRYSTSAFTSTDLSTAAGSQPGPDYVWWHATSGQWVPDAILDTSKLAGAPAAAIPASEPLSFFFAPAETTPQSVVLTAPDDDSMYATKADLAAAVAALPKPPTTGTIEGPLTVKLG